VEVDLGMNAAANARARHEVRKRAVAKQRKTVEANAKALAAAEAKTASTLAQAKLFTPSCVSNFLVLCLLWSSDIMYACAMHSRLPR
jgi:hypothetical protein